MLADHRHPEVGAVLAAIALRDRKAQMTGRIRAILGLAQQGLPFVARQAAILEIGACPFAAMVEETDIVVLLLQRLDLARDEAVEFVEIGDEVGGQVEIHGATSSSFFVVASLSARTACSAAPVCVIGWFERCARG